MADTRSNVRSCWVRPVAVLGLIGILLAGIVWLCTERSDTQPPSTDPFEIGSAPVDPRVSFLTEFRNVRPEVKYVGDTACAGCHELLAQTYHQHPMGRSAEWVRPGATVDHAAGARSSFDASGYRLDVVRKGDQIWHQTGISGGDVSSPAYAVQVDLAIGSGSRGRSYLTIDRGAAWQSPVSWYGQRDRWDVSPGFDLAREIRRPVVGRCLECHTDRPEPIPDSLNRYREPVVANQASIGCERCHGPGEMHVKERERGDRPALDTSIVNPTRLPPDLKADVCRQCHLQGAVQVSRRGREASEYRPGLPWEQFMSTFLWHSDRTDALKSVGQFEQMEASRCFNDSGGNLSCTSCHDPHAKPAAAAADSYFRGRCLTCHERRGCALPAVQRAEKKDNCVSCHMPRGDSANVVHIAVTDHRIMRRPVPGSPRARVLTAGQMPLVAYRPGPHAPGAAERDRDLAIALGNECARSGAAPGLWRAVEAHLDRALAAFPADGPVWITRSRVYGAHRDGAAAVESAQTAVKLNPGSEVALIQLAAAAIAADDHETAVGAAEKLIAMNPSSADHRQTQATAYFSLKDWEKAEESCRAALSIQPMRPNARFMLAVCRHQRGDAAGGRRELDVALKLTPSPDMRGTLSKWYEQLTR